VSPVRPLSPVRDILAMFQNIDDDSSDAHLFLRGDELPPTDNENVLRI
jgi:hypothetical protein